MTNVYALLLMLLPLQASAEPHFLQTLRGRQRFDEVERVSRNHDYGEYRGGDMTLRPYVQLGDHNYLGLDQTGRLMQVIRTPERTLGFLLSGERHLVDLFYRRGEALIAIDDRGEVLAFDRARWDRSPRHAIQKRMLASFGLTLLGTGATIAYVGLEWSLPLVEVLIPGIPITVGLALQHGLLFAMALSEENNTPDGFRAIGVNVGGYVSSEGVDAHGGGAEDYLLHAKGGTVSLRALLADAGVAPSLIFDASCEPNLARGYPIRMPYDDAKEKPKVKPQLLGRRESASARVTGPAARPGTKNSPTSFRRSRTRTDDLISD